MRYVTPKHNILRPLHLKRMRKLLLLAFLCTPSYAQLPSGSLWSDPGNIPALDFAGAMAAPVSPPKPPFTFLREDMSGTQPKIFARDATGATWNVKFGLEVRPESFCWRVVRACGYFAEPNFYVASGKFEAFQPIKRQDPSIHADGTFTDGRFQYRDPNLKFLDDKNWRWDRPPFGGTKELSGLKILIMLFSNWDNKDARVGAAGGPNTAIFALKKPTGTKYIYAFTDWGDGFGRLGPVRANWQCAAFTEQSAGFARSVEKGLVNFGYDGNINQGFRTGIPVSHVAWFIQYLGRITDAQLRTGFKSSGASDADAVCLTAAMRTRIEELRTAAAKAKAN
jgi:hypothetical protein